MENKQEIFCFIINDQQIGFPLNSVDRLLQAVAFTVVPNSPPMVHGLINFYGSLIPVINFRRRLKLPEKPIVADDYFLIVDTPRRKLAIVIDEVEDVLNFSEGDLINASTLEPGLTGFGFLKRGDGIILVIFDLDLFLSGEEDVILQEMVDHVIK
jgi:purine-binding chemotaxis protein CheW